MPTRQANAMFKATKIKCGSWLACESDNAVTDTSPSRASLLPEMVSFADSPADPLHVP